MRVDGFVKVVKIDSIVIGVLVLTVVVMRALRIFVMGRNTVRALLTGEIRGKEKDGTKYAYCRSADPWIYWLDVGSKLFVMLLLSMLLLAACVLIFEILSL